MLFGNLDALVAGSKAIGQAHSPASLALVHLQDDGGLAGWMFGWRVDDEKVGSHVGDADGFAVDHQPHLHLCRICTVILLRNHERDSDT